LKNIIYKSTSLMHSFKELIQLSDEASQKNHKKNITGFLIYDNVNFLQYIEGAPEQLDILMGKLQNDKRHRDIEVLHQSSLESRLFSEWGMRIALPKNKIIEKFTTQFKNIQYSNENYDWLTLLLSLQLNINQPKIHIENISKSFKVPLETTKYFDRIIECFYSKKSCNIAKPKQLQVLKDFMSVLLWSEV